MAVHLGYCPLLCQTRLVISNVFFFTIFSSEISAFPGPTTVTKILWAVIMAVAFPTGEVVSIF